MEPAQASIRCWISSAPSVAVPRVSIRESRVVRPFVSSVSNRSPPTNAARIATSGTARSSRTRRVAPLPSVSSVTTRPASGPVPFSFGIAAAGTVWARRAGVATPGARRASSSAACTSASVSWAPAGNRPVTTAVSKST